MCGNARSHSRTHIFLALREVAFPPAALEYGISRIVRFRTGTHRGEVDDGGAGAGLLWPNRVGGSARNHRTLIPFQALPRFGHMSMPVR